MKIERPIVLALAHNIFLAFSGITTALLVIAFFSEELQGVYYTIISFTALKVFLDAGFSNVIISFVSQNKSKIHIGEEVVFEEDGFKNLSNIFKYSRKRFLYAASIGFIILQIIALFFFIDYISSSTILYWLLLSLFVSLNILLIPQFSIIEGLGYLSSLYSFRIRCSILNSISSWIVIFFGGGVLCLLILNLVMLLQNFFYIKKYNNIFKNLNIETIDYDFIKPIVRPFSIRISLSFMTGYLVNNGIVPVIFRFISPVVAGQYGLTWSLFSTVSSLPKQFILVVRPKLGLLFKEKRYKAFWNLYFVNFSKSIALYMVLAVVILIVCHVYNNPVIMRLLDYNYIVLLALFYLVLNIKGNFDYFFRPQLSEPLYIHNILSTLTIILLLYFNIENLILYNLFIIVIISYGFFNFLGIISHVFKFYRLYLTKN